jgi:Fur family ferric uptake transcriptional regulator
MNAGPDATTPPPPQPTRPARGRSTRQKTAVNRALDELRDFVSAQDLFALLKDQGEQVSLATVYRILQQQQQEGLVDVLNPDDGESLYRRCEVQTHHHHLVCRRCGRAVEIYGICPDCSRP